MTIDEMKKRKQELGYTFAMLSERSGVPVPTIQKIFGGETSSPRYNTLKALQDALAGPDPDEGSSPYPQSGPSHGFVRESALFETGGYYPASLTKYNTHHYPRQGTYTVDDYLALPDEQRVELIDGVFYDMGAPRNVHQRIVGEVFRQIANFIRANGGPCEVHLSPTDVQLDRDNRTMVQPDVLIYCNEDADVYRLYGAPDFILEVISPTTKRKDCTLKLHKYANAGVREYWILDPYKEIILIYRLDEDTIPMIRGLDEPIPVGIYDGRLQIDTRYILEDIERYGKRLADDKSDFEAPES